MRTDNFIGTSLRRGFALGAIGMACCVVGPAVSAEHGGPFAPFSGEWRGAGRIETSDGKSESIRCRGRNDLSDAGARLAQSLVCAGDSYRLEIRSDVSVSGDQVTGSWQETTRGVGGSLSGQIGDGDFEGAVDGGGFTATISLRSNGRRQVVDIRPQSQAITLVSVALKRVSP